MDTCDKCGGSGTDGPILSVNNRPFACRKCEGTGKLKKEILIAEISDDEKTLIWINSLVKVVCHSCGGNPWSAKDGCGTCGHQGYKFRDEKTNEEFKRSYLERLKFQITNGPVYITLSRNVG